jgi:preprotein translocase subunit SecE
MDDFEEMTPTKRTAVRIISAILLIIVFCGVIWGADYILEIIKGLF